MSFSIADAMQQYRHTSDAVHKFWGYFQIVSVGAAGFAWSRPEDGLSGPLSIALAALYLMFAIASNVAVGSAQRELAAASSSIQSYFADNPTLIATEMRPMIRGIKTFDPRWVQVWHGVLAVATVTAVVATHPAVRKCLGGC